MASSDQVQVPHCFLNPNSQETAHLNGHAKLSLALNNIPKYLQVLKMLQLEIEKINSKLLTAAEKIFN